MSENKKKKMLDLPVKILFTEEGINFFIKYKKKLNKFTTADNQYAYGIFLDKFSPASVQRMMLIDYVDKIEISRVEYLSKRQEIMDLSKLLVYGVLYKQFDNLVFGKVIESSLIKSWNRQNPGNIIDEKTRMNDSYLEEVLLKNRGTVNQVKTEILEPLYASIHRNTILLPEEKNIQLLLSEKYLDKLRPFIWFILSRFKGTKEYEELLYELRELLRDYLNKSKISEYLSLMILELLSNAENTNLHTYARLLYKDGTDLNLVLYDSDLRGRIIQEMVKENEKVHLSWRVKTKTGLGTTRTSLEVTLYNRESEYRKLREDITDKSVLDLKEKSLTEFYKELPASQTNTELGMYYLSYLNDECRKVNVRFESNVNLLRSSDLAVITMILSF